MPNDSEPCVVFAGEALRAEHARRILRDAGFLVRLQNETVNQMNPGVAQWWGQSQVVVRHSDAERAVAELEQHGIHWARERPPDLP